MPQRQRVSRRDASDVVRELLVARHLRSRNENGQHKLELCQSGTHLHPHIIVGFPDSGRISRRGRRHPLIADENQRGIAVVDRTLDPLFEIFAALYGADVKKHVVGAQHTA